MHITRLFIDGNLEVGQEIILAENSAHHVLHVLRKKADDELILFNGKGGEYSAKISDINRNNVTVNIHEYTDVNRESPLQISLGLSILKRDAMNTALQKATELGVSKIVPVETTNTTVSRAHLQKRESQWQKVIVTACEQSGRTQVPALESVHSFNDYLCIDLCTDLCTNQYTDSENLKLIASTTAKMCISEIEHPAKSISLIIGPEGGFTDAEITLAVEKGFQPVSIGKRILRAETAPAVLLTLLQYRWGDF